MCHSVKGIRTLLCRTAELQHCQQCTWELIALNGTKCCLVKSSAEINVSVHCPGIVNCFVLWKMVRNFGRLLWYRKIFMTFLNIYCYFVIIVTSDHFFISVLKLNYYLYLLPFTINTTPSVPRTPLCSHSSIYLSIIMLYARTTPYSCTCCFTNHTLTYASPTKNETVLT